MIYGDDLAATKSIDANGLTRADYEAILKNLLPSVLVLISRMSFI